MKKSTKRWLSLTLTLVMLLGMVPAFGVAARAEDVINATTQDQVQSVFTNGGTVKLGSDISTNSTLTVASGKTVILDLNGYTIQTNGDNSVITVSGGTLTIQDSASGGCITGGKGTTISNVKFGGGVYVSGGTVNMTDGKISGNTANGRDAGYGGGVYIDNGIFNMTGGTISGNTAGGTAAGYGGGIGCVDSTLEMSGTSNITNNTAFNYGGGGGVLLVRSTFTMKNGTIENNTCDKNSGAYYGAAGVQVNANATLIIQGGEIKDAIKNATGSGHLKYGVTYKVIDGTWSDNTTADIIENVESGSKPASVPTGMKASEGYTGGAWDSDPSETTITEVKTFTYTFTAKQASTVTKAPTANNLTYTGSAQELVTPGTAEGGEMQYALGTATEATEPYTTSIPTAIDAGTYYVWYKVAGDDNHNDTDAQVVSVTIYNTYTVTWKNADGTVLETDENVAYGETPVYNGETPTKAADSDFTYTFAGWEPEITTVTGDATYTATYNSEAIIHNFTVTFVDEENNTTENVTVESGSTVTPPEPTAEGMVLVGWYAEGSETAFDFDTPITGDITLTAKWCIDITEEVISLDEEWVGYDGQEHKPEITTILTQDEDYNVTYTGNFTSIGTHTVTVTGIGEYAGTVTLPFQIKAVVTVKYGDYSDICVEKSYHNYKDKVTIDVSEYDYDYEGEKFSCWRQDDPVSGKIVGKNAILSFVARKNMTLYAVYEDKPLDPTAVTAITSVSKSTTSAGATAIEFVYSRSVPQGFKVTEQGMYYATNKLLGSATAATTNLIESGEMTAEEIKMILSTNSTDKVKSFKGTSTARNGTTSFKYGISEKNFNSYVYAMAYVKGTDANGNEYTVYSDVEAITYNSAV